MPAALGRHNFTVAVGASQPLAWRSITAASTAIPLPGAADAPTPLPCRVLTTIAQRALPVAFSVACDYSTATGNEVNITVETATADPLPLRVSALIALPPSDRGSGIGGDVGDTFLWEPPSPSSADAAFTLTLHSQQPLHECALYAITNVATIAMLLPASGVFEPRSQGLASMVKASGTVITHDFCDLDAWPGGNSSSSSEEPFDFPPFTFNATAQFFPQTQTAGNSRILFAAIATSAVPPMRTVFSYSWLWHATAVTLKQLPWPLPDAVVPSHFVQQLSQGFAFGFRGYPARFTVAASGPKEGGVQCSCAVTEGDACKVFSTAMPAPPLPPGASITTTAAWKQQIDVFVGATRHGVTPPAVTARLECTVYADRTKPLAQQAPLTTSSRSFKVHRIALPDIASFAVVPSSYVTKHSNGSITVSSPLLQVARSLAEGPKGFPAAGAARHLASSPLYSQRDGGAAQPIGTNFMTVGGNASIILTPPSAVPFQAAWPPAVVIAGFEAEVEVSADGAVAVVTPPLYEEVCGPPIEGGLTECDLANLYHTMTIQATEPLLSTLRPTLQCPPDCPPMAFEAESAAAGVNAKEWYSRAARDSFAPLGFATTPGTGVYFTQVCVGFPHDAAVCLDPGTAHLCAFGIGDGCRPCPSGCMCPGGPRCLTHAGWWTAEETAGQPVRCAPPAAERCVGWNVDTGRTQCGEGYKDSSYGCALCDKGYYPGDSGACTLCPDLSLSLEPILLPLGVLLGSAVLLFVVTYITVLIMAKVAGGTIAGGLRRAKDFLLSVFITLQVLVTAAQDFPPSTPPFLRSVLSGLSFFPFPIFLPRAARELHERFPVFYAFHCVCIGIGCHGSAAGCGTLHREGGAPCGPLGRPHARRVLEPHGTKEWEKHRLGGPCCLCDNGAAALPVRIQRWRRRHQQEAGICRHTDVDAHAGAVAGVPASHQNGAECPEMPRNS